MVIAQELSANDFPKGRVASLSRCSSFAARRHRARAAREPIRELVQGRGSMVVASVVARVVFVGSLHFGVKVSLAQPKHERDESTCVTALAGQAPRHWSRARYARCWATLGWLVSRHVLTVC